MLTLRPGQGVVRLKCPQLESLVLVSQTADTVIVDGKVVSSFLEQVLDGPAVGTVDLHLQRVWMKGVLDGHVKGFKNVKVLA